MLKDLVSLENSGSRFLIIKTKSSAETSDNQFAEGHEFQGLFLVVIIWT